MSLVAVEAEIVLADPADRDGLVQRTAPTQQLTRDEEPGCLAYVFAADPVRPDTVQAYELWESEDALHTHLQHPNYFAMRDLLGTVEITGVTARKHRIDKSAPVYGPDMKPSGHFD